MRVRSKIIRFLYNSALKPLLFRFDAEKVHARFVSFGSFLGRFKITRSLCKLSFFYSHAVLEQDLAGLRFENPVGLAAGFDHNARLSKILPYMGFGFSSVGTITAKSYEGNPKPRLARLPKSRSLLVNKGLKNDGIDRILERVRDDRYIVPIGISIGATNCRENASEKDAITDIVGTFRKTEIAKNDYCYYELNISCPNLFVKLDFYDPRKLDILLSQIGDLKLSKPLFIKMPISQSDEEVRSLLDVIIRHNVAGVVIGNLQKDRNNNAFDINEVSRCGSGNFSGKPTEERSNELISLAYREYGDSLIIIGCGGVFSAEGAYKKIQCGASLIQLITGMIYEGPQLISEINEGLVRLLKKDGHKHICQAVGSGHGSSN